LSSAPSSSPAEPPSSATGPAESCPVCWHTPTLIPITLGCITAHYLTLLLFEGQRVFITSSDPLSRGWNLFGTAELGVNYTLANYPGLIGLIQAGALVVGHILGVIAAHDRALTLQPRGQAVIGQIPMMVLMIGYTTAGLLLLFTE